MLEDYEEKLVDLLREGVTYEDMQDELGDVSSTRAARRRLNKLRDKGVKIQEKTLDTKEKLFYLNQEERSVELQEKDNYKIGVVSDTHLGSEAEQLDSLEKMYEEMEEKDVDLVLHAGDISDGCDVYRGQSKHKKPEAIGWGRLIDYVVENYPKNDEFKTLFIDGNHDEKLFQKTGIPFGERVAKRRDDLVYLGEGYARVELGDIDIDMVHPSGGTPYTLGYRAQTWLRNKNDSEKADITIFGHLHQMLDGKTEGSHILYAGAFQGQTPYLDKKGIKTQAGAHILEVDCDEDGIEHINIDRYDYEIEKVADVEAEIIEEMMS